MTTPTDATTLAEAKSPFPRMVRLRFRLIAHDRLQLPEYAGSTWRGLLGQGLRRTVCITRQPRCAGCLLLSNCVYPRVFETEAHSGKDVDRFADAPRPYVLEPDVHAVRDVAPGERMSFGLTVLGPAIEQIPSLILGLRQAGNLGLGRTRGRFALEALECERSPGSGEWQVLFEASSGDYSPPLPAPCNLPAPPLATRLSLHTPLRLKRHGHFVGARDFNAADFLFNLCSRLRLLSEHYGGNTRVFDWQELYGALGEIELAYKKLHWHDWTRYSSRQGTRMRMGGLLGEFALGGETLPTFWPALWFGQWVHAGKGTTFGLGGYRLAGEDELAAAQSI